MASVIVLNSKSRSSVSGFCESKAVVMAVATGATVFEVELVLRLAFVVAFTFWWRRRSAESQASHLCARMYRYCLAIGRRDGATIERNGFEGKSILFSLG